MKNSASTLRVDCIGDMTNGVAGGKARQKNCPRFSYRVFVEFLLHMSTYTLLYITVLVHLLSESAEGSLETSRYAEKCTARIFGLEYGLLSYSRKHSGKRKSTH